MATNEAAKEIDRIERELDAKGQPSVQPPKSRSGNDRNGDHGGEPPKHHHLDAVLVGAVLLAGIGLTFWVGEKLSPRQKTQLSAGTIGGAAGLLIGYGVGRIKH
tara:strand:+ start:125 stop:436 length:312 start_codon:yes stop_codon:yes gene_type:complete